MNIVHQVLILKSLAISFILVFLTFNLLFLYKEIVILDCSLKKKQLNSVEFYYELQYQHIKVDKFYQLFQIIFSLLLDVLRSKQT
jgi:hypothetical protein